MEPPRPAERPDAKRHHDRGSSLQEPPRWLVTGLGLFVCVALVLLLIFGVTQIVDATRPEATIDSNGRACIDGGNENLPDCK